MKRTLRALFLLFILILTLPQTAVFAEDFKVYDETNTFSAAQSQRLEALFEAVSEKYNIDVAIAVTEKLYSATVMKSADDFYDDGDYGLGGNDDGILLYICMDTHEYHITTHAKAMDVFNENGIRYLKEQIVPYLKSGDYYGAAEKFVQTSEELLEMAANGEPYNEKPKKNAVIPIIAAIVISFIISSKKTSKKLSQMKTANKQTYANNYVKSGSMNVTLSKDIFLYSRTDKREKQKSSNTGDRHTSSSGRTHGGGSGSF